jgi:hypothetical protein
LISQQQKVGNMEFMKAFEKEERGEDSDEENE